ncbi:MAG: hypothetical protein IPF98_23915 [Gemmatimonadetes bacterium]|nr:hypothetical protein [Gemmatimonadota bacterium]
MKQTIENAKREALMTTEIIGRIEARQRNSVEPKESRRSISVALATLVKAHESFAENVERSLREGNRQFQAELSTAVQLLSGAIKNLGDVIDDFSPRR